MRRTAVDHVSLLVAFWVAVQLAPPLFLIGLSSGEHRLSFHAADGRLLLEHRHSEAPTHRHLPIENVLIPIAGGEEEHADHVVRFPQSDHAARPDLPGASATSGTCVSSPAFVIPTRATFVSPTTSSRIGPAPPHRTRPLLL
ncbi:MAG: hypothetical protein ACREQY_15845 [Candidatus Binatia bacterium]